MSGNQYRCLFWPVQPAPEAREPVAGIPARGPALEWAQERARGSAPERALERAPALERVQERARGPALEWVQAWEPVLPARQARCGDAGERR